MATDDHNSISFILGLNQFQENNGTDNVEATSGDTNPLLAGLNTLPSGGPEQGEDTMTNFTNQLSLWTNASFSFDGPMGHALIGDEEKEPPKGDGRARRDEDEERMQRYFAASSAHSNAARDKNRELDRDSRPQSTPPYQPPRGADASSAGPFASGFLHPVGPLHEAQRSTSPGRGYSPSQPLPGLSPQDTHAWRMQSVAGPPAKGADHTPQPVPGQNWDLTSTLALQYLLSKNPSMLQNLPMANQGNSNVPGPSWPGGTGPVQNLHGTPNAYPSPQAPVDPYQLLQSGSTGGPIAGPSHASSSTSLHGSSGNGPQDTERPPTGEFTFSPPNDARKPAVTRKRSATSLQTRGNTPKGGERAAESEDDPQGAQSEPAKPESARPSRSSSASERIKLVNTGNPEADAEANRLAIEEDKRRRNTAASARFRVKKKQREAALEMSARELESQVNELKQANERLRTENEWLKRLITARPEGLSALLGASMPPQQFPVPPRPNLDMAQHSSPMGLGKGAHEPPPE
ncbi:hypothetical protein MOBT1_001487 [Malassezia obtusa]|uniref:BZIP domain-containing protein n=1 Tax=Malassezia obtusa TaxID=76774 RepID=A0AAF0E3F0_9BASI|nr:hypothetical protein MOBT1_001487 [Malassezia obtusa]